MKLFGWWFSFSHFLKLFNDPDSSDTSKLEEIKEDTTVIPRSSKIISRDLADCPKQDMVLGFIQNSRFHKIYQRGKPKAGTEVDLIVPTILVLETMKNYMDES